MKMRRAKLMVVLLTLAGLAAAAAVTVFLFVPAFREVVRLSKGITDAHAELNAQYDNRKNLLSSLSDAEKARSDMQTLAAQFVPEGRELDFITSIENLAAKDGVEEHVTLSPNDGSKPAEELQENYDLTVNGKYRSVMQMLVDLEKAPTLLLVGNVVVRPGPGAAPGDESFLSVNMHGMLAAPPKGL